MFKNVVNVLKFKNQLQDSVSTQQKRKQKNKRKNVIFVVDEKSNADGSENDKAASAANAKCGSLDATSLQMPATGQENFLVRQGRKKLTTLIGRLQRVKSLSKRARERQADFDQFRDGDKPKFVIDYNETNATENNQQLNRLAQQNQQAKCAAEDDDDDDDAYVSANESFENDDERSGFYDDDDEDDDDEDDNKQNKGDDQTQPESRTPTGAIVKPIVINQSSKETRKDDAAVDEEHQDDNKFILPEEQCDIPTFLNTKNCDRKLIDETRVLLKERYEKNPESFYESDYRRMIEDDWTVTRFLLRRRLEPIRTAKLMEECGKFRREFLMGEIEHWEFPAEFHIAGGLFKYAPDKVGNVTMYMRIKMYRRVPEISDVFKAFILCVLEQCDVANNGRGTAVVFDLSSCGLQNVDLGFLYWLLNSFRNYCPKGVSYILVYNLPWFLSATAKLAMTWMSATNRRALRFVQGKEIENFISRENLPDYLGGTCPINYREIPKYSRPAIEVCNRLEMSPEQAMKIKQLFKEYLPDNYEALIPPLTPELKRANQESADNQHNSTTQQQPPSEQQQTFPTTNTSGQQTTTMPVVQLVSTASKFIAN